MANNPIYDSIGKNYDLTRKADPIVVDRIIKQLQVIPSGKYLDIGCGTGNYTIALHQKGLCIEGVDISQEMLGQAKSKCPKINWHQSDASALPFVDDFCNGIVCTFATHHMHDINQVFSEMFRVINHGRVVLFTATPEQMQHYWLCEYFPAMIDESAKTMAGFDELNKSLTRSGFKNIQQDIFFVPEKMQDLFLMAGKHSPEIYLDPNVREGISAFKLFAEDNELHAGLKALEQDIQSGKIKEIMQKYQSDLGDYMLVVGEKPLN
ncbi:MAG: class I SAM-dependent methyltransferase [Gammaproteobacteria bacterium]|nr:class I SAM-dependent methyltransferase [Gammaproteobacteria bacterium]